MNAGQAAVDVVHVNNDFPETLDSVASDHEPVVAVFTLPQVVA